MADPFGKDVESVASNIPGTDYDPIEVETKAPKGELDRGLALDQYATQEAAGRLLATVNKKFDAPTTDPDVDGFSVKYQTDPETAARLLRLYGDKDAEIVHKAPDMAKNNRALVNWAAQADKYPFFKNNLEAIEEAQDKMPWKKTPTYMQDLGNALRRNMPTLENAYVIGKYTMGAMNKEQLAEALHNIQKRRDEATPYGTDTEGLDKALQEFNLEIDKNIKSGKDLWALNNEDWDDYVRSLVKASELAGATGLDIANLAWAAFVKNPAATGLKSTESIGSFLGPTAGRVAGGIGGAAIGKFGGPIGAAAGGLGGALVGSAFIRYAEEVNEQLSGYTDAQGNVDYLAALNDPEVMANIKLIATTYGAVGGVLDTAFGGLGGKIPVKGTIGKVLEITAEGVAEGAAEAGATTAKGVVEGKDAITAAGEGLREGVIESILVTPTAGAISFLPGVPSALGNQILKAKRTMNRKAHANTVKEKVKAVREIVKEGAATPEDAANFREVFDVLAQQEEPALEKERRANISVEDIPSIPQPPSTIPSIPETPVEEEQIEQTSDTIFIEGRKLQQAFNELAEAGKAEGLTWEQFLLRFDGPTHGAINRSIEDNTPLEMSANEWAIATAQIPVFDQVMEIYTPWGVEPGADTEANIAKEEEEQEKVKEEIKKQKKEIKKEEPKKIGRFKTAEDKKLYGRVQKELIERFSRGGVRLPPETVSAYTDIFFQMIQTRAEILERPLAEVFDEFYITTGKEVETATNARINAFGYRKVNPTSNKSVIVYNTARMGTEQLTTLVHEIGHHLLHGMMMDWQFIMSKDPKTLTPLQSEYKATILATAKALGSDNLQLAQIEKLQESFAQTIEKFFVEGKFTEGPKGEFLLKFQQMLQDVMTVQQLAKAGTNYNPRGIYALPISKDADEGANMIFNSLMGAGQTLKEEVYPLIPEPNFTEKELGSEYKEWIEKYKAAILHGLTKVYNDLYNDNRKYYKTAFPKVYNEVRERLNGVKLGELSQLIKDGFIKIQQKDLKEALNASSTYIKNISTVLPIVKQAGQATVTIASLRQRGYLHNTDDGRALEELYYATNLDKAAEIETINELERRKGSLPRKDLQQIVNTILGDEELHKVRLEANRIMRKKYAEDMHIVGSRQKFLPTLSTKAINKAAKERAYSERWGMDWSTYAAYQDTAMYYADRRDEEIPYQFQGGTFTGHIKGRSFYDLKMFRGSYNAEKRLFEALESGDIPVIIDSLTQYQIALKAEKHKKEVSDRVTDIQKQWGDFFKNLEGPVYIDHPSGYASIVVYEDDMEYITEKKIPNALNIEDSSLYNKADFLVFNAARGTNIMSKVNYRWLNEEATFKSQFLQKMNTKGPATPNANSKAKMTEKDLDPMMDVPDADYNPIKSEKELHLPPVPQDKPKGSKLSWDDSKAVLEEKITSEVTKFKQRRKIPESTLGRYFYYNSVSVKNFIASMVKEADVATSWLVKIFQKVSQAEAKKNVEHNKQFNRIIKAVKTYGKSKKGNDVFKTKEKGGWFSYMFNQFTGKDSAIAAPELGEGVQFANIGQVITGLLYAGSHSGRQKLLGGGFVTNEGRATGPLGVQMNNVVDPKAWDAFVQRLVNEGVLTKEAFDMVQEIHDVFTEIFPLVKQAFIDVEGADINFIEGRGYSVKFADGTTQKYRGGYYPLVSDKTLTGDLENVGANTYKADVKIAYDILDSSMMHRRTDATYPLDLNINLMSFILNKHLIHAYIKKPLTIVENLRNMPKVAELFENRQPGFIKEILNPWITRVAQQRYAVQGGNEFLGSMALYLRRTTGIALFFGNVASMAKQLLGVVQAFPALAQNVGRARVLKHLVKMGMSTGFGQYNSLKNEISEKSIFMKDRMDNNQRNLVRGWDEMDLTESPREKTIRLAESGAYMGLQFFQNHVDMAMWLAAVEKSKKDGRSDSEAYDYADNLVERTQFSGNISARSSALHGTHWERLAMMISMVAFGLRGQIYEQAARAEAAGENVTLARANALIWLTLIPTLLTYTAGKALSTLGDDDDDDDENKEEIQYLMAQLSMEIGDAYAPQVSRLLLPLVSGALEGAGVTHPRRQSLFGLGPVESPVKQSIKAATAISRSARYNVPLSYSEISAILTGTTIASGLPLTPISRYIIPYIEENQTRAEKRRFSRKRRKALKKIKDKK